MKSIWFYCFIGLAFVYPLNVVADKPQFEISFISGALESVTPYKKINNLMVIPVKINGRILNLILDTGTKNIVLFTKTDFKEIFTQNQVSYSIYNKNFDGKVILDNILDLPGIQGKKIPIILGCKQWKDNVFEDQDIDGIIGYNLFARFSVEVNANNRTIILRTPGFEPERSFSEYPIKIYGTNSYVEFNYETNHGSQKKGFLMIDTGAMPAFIFSNQIPSRQIKNSKFISVVKLNYLASKLIGAFRLIKEIEVLNSCYQEVKAIVVKNNWFYKYSGINRIGTIGMGYFERYNFIIDYPNQKLYLKPTQGFSTL